MRQKIIQLFDGVAQDYARRGVATTSIYPRHDIHAYIQLLPQTKNLVVHVQGCPGLSTENNAHVCARLMDYQKMAAIQSEGRVSIGNEHEAVIKRFPTFENGFAVPYIAEQLEGLLGISLPDLIIPTDKWTLRDYLKTIQTDNPVELAMIAPLIMVDVERVMAPYLTDERGEDLHVYYEPAVRLLRTAVQNNDFAKLASRPKTVTFPQALEFMIDSVDWE